MGDFNTRSDAKKNFLVQIQKDSDITELISLRHLLFQVISWDKLKKETIVQCKKCQGFNHMASNCSMGYKCVKCKIKHQPGACSIDKNTERKDLYCVNCDQMGHPASYRGCPEVKKFLEKQKEILKFRKKSK